MTFTTKTISSETHLARLIRSLPAINRFVVTNIKILGVGAITLGMFLFLSPAWATEEFDPEIDFDTNIPRFVLKDKLHNATQDYDLDKLAHAVAFAETAGCTDGTAIKRHNCFGIMHWPNGKREPKYYKSHAESYADFKRIWSKNYGRFPDEALARKWTGNDHPDTWLANVRHKYSQL